LRKKISESILLAAISAQQVWFPTTDVTKSHVVGRVIIELDKPKLLFDEISA